MFRILRKPVCNVIYPNPAHRQCEVLENEPVNIVLYAEQDNNSSVDIIRDIKKINPDAAVIIVPDPQPCRKDSRLCQAWRG